MAFRFIGVLPRRDVPRYRAHQSIRCRPGIEQPLRLHLLIRIQILIEIVLLKVLLRRDGCLRCQRRRTLLVLTPLRQPHVDLIYIQLRLQLLVLIVGPVRNVPVLLYLLIVFEKLNGRLVQPLRGHGQLIEDNLDTNRIGVLRLDTIGLVKIQPDRATLVQLLRLVDATLIGIAVLLHLEYVLEAARALRVRWLELGRAFLGEGLTTLLMILVLLNAGLPTILHRKVIPLLTVDYFDAFDLADRVVLA